MTGDVHAGSAFTFGHRPVGDGAPCVIIGEVGLSHDGSLGAAHSMIDIIADCGADAAKFQTHIAEEESSPEEPWRTKFSHQDTRRYDYWKRTAFTTDQWAGLAEHCARRGLEFLSSPFSVAAVNLLDDIGVPAWKIASGEVTNSVLLDAVLATGKPVLLSSGMSTLRELGSAVSRIRAAGVHCAVLQCSTEYPTRLEHVGLNQIAELREFLRAPIGLSDHSGTTFVPIAASVLGAAVLELHITLHRRAFGPDVSSSLTVEEFSAVVEAVRGLEIVRTHPVHKDQRAEELEDLRRTFGQSLVARIDLAAGAVLTRDALGCRKPLNGIPAAQLDAVIGLRTRRAITAGSVLQEADVEGPEGES